MFTGETILVAPLDWGLGHATRMVPLIRNLAISNYVVICSSPGTADVLAAYFPALIREEIPSYRISYSTYLPQWLKVMLSVPSILKQVKRERKACRKLVQKHEATLTISDNRYGFYSHKVTSIFMTHQLNLLVPVAGKLATYFQRLYLKRFTELWVPDNENSELSGQLSRSRPDSRLRFIGPQSALLSEAPLKQKRSDLLILLSGPEPQRSMLENRLVGILKNMDSVVLVRGTKLPRPVIPDTWIVHDVATGGLLRGVIEAAGKVVCRSGYSTLMDLHLLGKKDMVLIPTPGQPEQVYLADHWRKKFGAAVVRQRNLNPSFLQDQNSFTP